MHSITTLKRPRAMIFGLAGLGLVAGLVFAADRAAIGDATDTVTFCTRLNVGDAAAGDNCGRAYMTKAGFDRVFADVEAASTLNPRDAAVFSEKLRLAGAKRLLPGAPVERLTVVKTRIASAESPGPMRPELDPTLRTTELDQGAIFKLLLEDPQARPADRQVSQSEPPSSGS